ncbi:AsnC family transcriptional regulator [Actinorhabdospora filicis]|uniref:AsnC family transcriptional regulator n=1 Tax=Actinorhabdospora filicis TaxID=1785913 RepID=A0A9W6W9K7_9ACTN|nr:AsnC family transcriptional regulator [Actinorhabdospora filicis]GLZ78739.1 AsnC family transcriptional regulator [Actinorhabdospora filicis]
MEDLDRQIVAALTADGRMSYTELAERVGLSTSAVHQRVKRLEERGVILGYTARLDYEKAGLPLTAFVAIKPIDPAADDDAPQRLSALPEIEDCHSVAGEDFYLLKVRVNGPTALERLLARIRSEAGVTHRTTIVLSTPYEGRVPNLDGAKKTPLGGAGRGH